MFRILGILAGILSFTFYSFIQNKSFSLPLLFLGLDVSHEALPAQLTLKDFLLFADAAAPDDDPEGGAKTMNCLISQNSDGSPGDISPQDLINFCHSLGKPPPSLNEAKVYISMLQDYDECDEIYISANSFQKELVRQSKLNHVYEE